MCLVHRARAREREKGKKMEEKVKYHSAVDYPLLTPGISRRILLVRHCINLYSNTRAM